MGCENCGQYLDEFWHEDEEIIPCGVCEIGICKSCRISMPYFNTEIYVCRECYEKFFEDKQYTEFLSKIYEGTAKNNG